MTQTNDLEALAAVAMALCENALGGKRCPCKEAGKFNCADEYPGQQARAALTALRAQDAAPVACAKCERIGYDCGEHLPSWEELANYWRERALKAEVAHPNPAPQAAAADGEDILAKALCLLDSFADEGLGHVYGNGTSLDADTVCVELAAEFGVEFEPGWYRKVAALCTRPAATNGDRLDKIMADNPGFHQIDPIDREALAKIMGLETVLPSAVTTILVAHRFATNGDKDAVIALLEAAVSQFGKELPELTAQNAALREALEVAGDAINEMFRYFDGGETRGSYDGKPERAQLRKAGYTVQAALANRGEAGPLAKEQGE